MRRISRPQRHRNRRIIDMIKRGKYPNATDFAQECGVSRGTIVRNLDYLRDEENAPIEYNSSKRGFYLSDQTWQLPVVTLSAREVFAFSIARKMMDSFRGTPLEMDMQSVLNKIAESVDEHMTMDAESITDHFTVIGDDYVKQDPETWDVVSRCLERQEKMLAIYQKFRGEINDYTLSPYHLFSYHGNWYVLAFHERADKVATFALSRFKSIVASNVHF